MSLRNDPLTEQERGKLRGMIRARWDKDKETYDDAAVAAAAVMSGEFDQKMISAKLVISERKFMGIDLREQGNGGKKASAEKDPQNVLVTRKRRGRQPGSKNKPAATQLDAELGLHLDQELKKSTVDELAVFVHICEQIKSLSPEGQIYLKRLFR